MVTPIPTGQKILHHGNYVPLLQDKNSGNYYVKLGGVSYIVDPNCILRSKLADTKEGIQEQAEKHHNWMEYYQNMVACAKAKGAEAKENIKELKAQIRTLFNDANTNDYKNLEVAQQKEFVTCKQQISDNRSIQIRSSSEVIHGSHCAANEAFDEGNCKSQSIICDKLST